MSENLNNVIASNIHTSSSKEQINIDLDNLLNELSKLKNEATLLYKNNKIEEAINKYIEIYKILKKELPKIHIDYSYSYKYDEIMLLYRKILSKLALCYYIEGNYTEAIKYDLKVITLEPKNVKSIVRLFNSYSKNNKCLQAVYYGKLFKDLDIDLKNKFKGMDKIIEEEEIKLKKMQECNIIKYFISLLIFFLAILLYYIIKK